ncbi:MAG: peptidylprolyl isomerase [Clostridia bacterium]|nr:peptidylprolyl isomerase [Clostridia bacterium]
MTKKLLSLILAAIFVATALVSCGNSTSNQTESESATQSQTAGETSAPAFIPGGDENADVKSVYTENFAFTNAEIAYAVMSSYQNIIYNAQYYGGAAAFGIDTSKSLKEQPCAYLDDGSTWFDYFLEGALTTASEVLSICEAAKAANFEMTEDVKEAIDSNIASFESSATQAGLTVEEYFRQNLGEVVTPDVLRSVLEKSYYAQAYISYCAEQIDVSDAALEAAYNADTKIADTVDFLLLVFDPQSLLASQSESADSTDTSATTPTYTEAEIEAAMNVCRTEASAIAKATTKDEFIAAATASLTKGFGMSAEDAATTVTSGEYTAQAYQGEVVTEKAFSINEGETFVIEDETDGVIYVGFLLKKNGRNESASTRSVRHILFKHDTYKDDTVVKQVYNDWVAAGATVDEFITLAKQYSEDPGSANSGGLYEGVKPGEMVDEFNDWLFDSARVVGDHAIVESSSYGWHIMYFEADGEPAWKTTVKSYLQNAESERVVTGATETYKPTVDEAVLATVPA